MYLQLPTHHRLLTKSFPKVRESLGGEVVLFDASNYPAMPGKPVAKPAQIQEEKKPTTATVSTKQATPSSFSIPQFTKRTIKLALALVSFLSLLSVIVYFAPQVYYAYIPADTIDIQYEEPGSALGGDFSLGAEETTYVPEFNPNLPEGEWLVIPRIGVYTELRQTEDPDEALAEGVWWVPGYGEAGSKDMPMILAAHRFGWDWWWQSDYWKYNSFYLLPDTQPGDTIEVIVDQRKWVYEIYAGEEGELISDYSADMILYTCKFLNSPVRHFRYARLINPEKDTQATNSPSVSSMSGMF